MSKGFIFSQYWFKIDGSQQTGEHIVALKIPEDMELSNLITVTQRFELDEDFIKTGVLDGVVSYQDSDDIIALIRKSKATGLFELVMQLPNSEPIIYPIKYTFLESYPRISQLKIST